MLPPQIDEHLDEDVLEQYALRVLPADLIQTVDEHLLKCALCQAKLTETDEFVALFRAAATEVLETPQYGGSLWAKIFGLRRVQWAMAMAVAVIAAGPFVIWETGRQSAQAPEIVLLQAFRGPESGARVEARKSVVLRFDVPAVAKASDCKIEVVDLDGKKVVESEPALVGGSLEASVGRLKPGGYWVRLFRRSDNELLGEYSLSAKEDKK